MRTIKRIPRTSETFKKIIADDVFKAVFTKVDGSKRTLIGTLNKDVIEKNNAVPTGTGKALPDNSYVRVYELDENGLGLGWKTIILKTLKKLSIIG